MMRFCMLISLLLLSVLIHEAQGIRLIIKGTPPNGQHISHKILQGRSNDGVEEVISLCKDKHCSGMVRKLMMTPISSTSTTAKNQNNKNKENITAKEENLSVNSSSTAEQRQPTAATETYPGVLDIAGMDYSQARRKPPIHN